ncbi:hypothetical protein P7K49_029133 [Saguinus oedipus]|uniref:CB1 cannabinoid receptor-interacting protein 1 n=1 Tax=Saguinus oedipus TaxID=9490 RepID=A0ABQ9U780_SAGOE|nr:hypothetical protein P7K49_029133 [Saguinus oedipus]
MGKRAASESSLGLASLPSGEGGHSLRSCCSKAPANGGDGAATAPDPRPDMGDLPGLVRLSIALRIQPNDGPVFYKVDGQRFGQNRTIKLLTGSSYKVEVKIKPSTLQVE